MKQVFLLLGGVIGLILIIGVLNKYPNEAGQALSNPTSYANKTIQTTLGDKKSIKIGEIELIVEIADEEAERAQGLSGRKSLAENEGMLFVFGGKDVKPAFWMKDMLMPIDIIWINDRKVAQIDKDIQPPDEGTPDRSLPLIIPDGLIDYVLEVSAGFSDKNKLENGVSIDLTNVEKSASP